MEAAFLIPHHLRCPDPGNDAGSRNTRQRLSAGPSTRWPAGAERVRPGPIFRMRHATPPCPEMLR